MIKLRERPIDLLLDEDLLAAYARSRDADALGELVKRRWPEAYRIALRALGDPGAAEDAAQEAFVRLLRAARTFDPGRPFGPWFRKIVLNAVRRHIRASDRRRRHEEEAAMERSTVVTLPEGERRLAAAEVEAHVRRLSPDVRFPVILHFYEGCSHDEVAATVGCPTGTASSRIRRGLEQLRTSLVGAGYAVTAVELGALLTGTPPTPPPPPVRLLEAAARKLAVRALWQGASVAALVAGVAVALALAVAPAPSKTREIATAGGAVRAIASGDAALVAERPDAPGARAAGAERPDRAGDSSSPGAGTAAKPAAAKTATAVAPVATRVWTSFRGRLVDENHTPLAGAPLRLRSLRPHVPGRDMSNCSGDLGKARTARDGSFSIAVLEPRRLPRDAPVILEEEGTGHWLLVLEQPLEGITGGVLDRGEVTFHHAAFAQISVFVHSNAQPAAALVHLDGRMHRVLADTDAGGCARFFVDPEEQGPFELSIPAMDGLPPVHRDLVLDGADMTVSIDLARETEERIAGCVTGPKGQPLAGVNVSLVRRLTNTKLAIVRTDATGAYAFSGLARGDHFLVAASVDASLALFDASEDVTTPAPPCDLTLTQGGTLHVQLETREPDDWDFERCYALFTESEGGGWRASATGDITSGTFTVKPLPAGHYRIAARRGAVGAVSAPFEVEEQEEPRTFTLPLVPMRKVSGFVRDGGGAPIVGAYVEVELSLNGYWNDRTGADGSFSVSAPDQPVALTVTAPGFADALVTLPVGATTIPDVVLSPDVRAPTDAAKKRGSEAAAIGALKTITTAEAIFREGDKDMNGDLDYGTLAQLAQTKLVDDVLGAGEKDGYVFEAFPCPHDPHFRWYATASPKTPGENARYFFANQSGVIFYAREPFKVDPTTCRVPKGLLPVGN
jgi:RNA polymerase sigma-70 factor (ECF subfamily)